MKYTEMVYWNKRTYGSSIKIKRKWIIAGIIFFCLITPFTNWIIPLLDKIIKTDLIWRF